MEKKTFVKGLTFLTASRLLQEPDKIEAEFWFSQVQEYQDDIFHEAIMDIVKHTAQIFPGTNIVALFTEKMDSIIYKMEQKIKYDEAMAKEEANKILLAKQSDQRLIDAEAAEKRLLTPEYQENLRRMDGDFSKYIKDMTKASIAHCDKFIDKSKIPLDMKSLKEPWSDERIEETRKKLRNETNGGLK